MATGSNVFYFEFFYWCAPPVRLATFASKRPLNMNTHTLKVCPDCGRALESVKTHDGEIQGYFCLNWAVENICNYVDVPSFEEFKRTGLPENTYDFSDRWNRWWWIPVALCHTPRFAVLGHNAIRIWSGWNNKYAAFGGRSIRKIDFKGSLMQLLTFNQAAELLSCSRNGVQILVDRGDLPVINLSERIRRIDQADLIAFIEQKKCRYTNEKVQRITPPTSSSTASDTLVRLGVPRNARHSPLKQI